MSYIGIILQAKLETYVQYVLTVPHTGFLFTNLSFREESKPMENTSIQTKQW